MEYFDCSGFDHLNLERNNLSPAPKKIGKTRIFRRFSVKNWIEKAWRLSIDGKYIRKAGGPAHAFPVCLICHQAF